MNLLKQPPTPYSFEYAVSDEPSGNDFGHQEESDGKVVTGQYRVLLPDGRTQIVTYRADENGYRANVRYEGEAVFPPPPPKVSYPPPASKTDYPPKPAYPKY
jgi:Insect cuticle protein